LNRKYLIIISLFFMLFIITFVLGNSFVDDVSIDFDNGTYFNTQFNGTAVILTGNNLTGGYTSRVFDAGFNSSWKNISFVNDSGNFNVLFAVDGIKNFSRSNNSGINWAKINSSYGGSSTINHMFSDNSGNIYMLVNKDVYKSNDSGLNWSIINGSFSGSNNLFVGASDSNNNLFAVDGSGDVYKSNNSGVSWIFVGDINSSTSNQPKGIAINFSNAIFIIEGSTKAVYQSTNLGVSWTRKTNDYGGTTAIADMASDNNGNLYILQDKKIYQSTNLGVSWTIINNSFTPYSANGIKMTKDNRNYIYITDGNGKVFKSMSQGINWSEVGDFNGADTNNPQGITSILQQGNLSFFLKSCNLANCSDGSFISVNQSSNFNITGRYFQYLVNLSRVSNESNVLIYNVSIGYDLINEAPNIDIILPQNNSFSNNNQSIKLNFSVSDVNNNTQSCWYTTNNGVSNFSISNCLNTTFNVSGEGNYTLKVFVNDSLDLSNYSSVNFTVDMTKPSISLIYPQSNLYNSSQSILNYSVLDVNLANCWYSTNNSVNITLSCNSNVTGLVSSEGNNTWKIYANDSAGNENSSLVNFEVDTTNPSVSIIFPVEGSTFGSNLSINLNYSATDTNLQSCWYNVNNGTNITLTNCANTTFNVSGSGNYIIYLYANDSLGHLSFDFNDFSVSVGAPSITSHYPVNQYLNFTNNIPFNYTPSDIDLGACELWGNFSGVFTLNQTNLNPVNNSVNIFYLNLSEGSYFWNVRCNDSAIPAHSAFNGNKTFFVDTTSPVISLTAPTGTYNSLTGIPLTFSITDSSPVSCIYNFSPLNTGTPVIEGTLPNCTSTTFNVDNQVAYRFFLTVNDSAGNRNIVNSTFSIDTSVPSGGDNGGSSGGGGGGSGSGFINSSLLSNARVSVSEIGSIIANEGDKKTLSINVNNIGKIFLNNCRLKAIGDIDQWFYSDEVRGIAPGQSVDFLFNINIPEEIKGGDYFGKLMVSCKELNQSQDILVSIPFGLDFIEIRDIIQDENILTINYIFNNSKFQKNDFSVNIWVENENNEKIVEIQDIFSGDEDGETLREVLIELPRGVSGVHYVYFSLSEEPENYVRRSTLLTPITGRAIFDNTRGKIFTYAVFAFILGSGIFFILKNFIHTRRYNPFKKSYWRSRRIHKKINIIDKSE